MREELIAIITSPEFGAESDVARLASALYQRCYVQSILEPAADAADERDLTPALHAANQSSAVWDEGWRLEQALDDGRVIATKAGAARAFLPGEFLTHRGPGVAPEKGRPISVLTTPAAADLQPGFYHAFGETVSCFEENEALIRFYWNISAEGAPYLLRAVTGEFNRFQVPFHFKCANCESRYPRRDAAVLYVHRRWYPIAAMLVEAIHARVIEWLGAGTPLFTRRLAHGLALAEDPGDSFGSHRCKILAEALSAAQGREADAVMAELARQFEQRGLSLERPWVNAGSIDSYEYPFPVA